MSLDFLYSSVLLDVCQKVVYTKKGITFCLYSGILYLCSKLCKDEPNEGKPIFYKLKLVNLLEFFILRAICKFPHCSSLSAGELQHLQVKLINDATLPKHWQNSDAYDALGGSRNATTSPKNNSAYFISIMSSATFF